MRRILTIIVLALFFCSCADGKVRQYKLQVVSEYPHDTGSYTQGLFFDGGNLYESTGQYGSSTFRIVDLASGKALRKLDFGKKYFVEGSVMLEGNFSSLRGPIRSPSYMMPRHWHTRRHTHIRAKAGALQPTAVSLSPATVLPGFISWTISSRSRRL